MPPWSRYALGAACALTLLGLLLVSLDEAPAPVHPLLKLGLSLVTLSALVLLAALLREREQGVKLWLSALTSGLLGVSALMAHRPELTFGVYPPWHAHFIGIPSELAFVALSGAALALRARPTSRAASWALSGASLWAAASLFMPNYWLTALSLPIWSSQSDATLTPLLLLGPLVAAITALAFSLKRRSPSAPFSTLPQGVMLTVACGPLLLALHHVFSPLVAPEATLIHTGLGLVLAGQVVGLALMVKLVLTRDSEFNALGLHARLDWAACGLLLTLYAALKIHGMGPSNTDENIYFYMAEALSRGEWPYIDYFFAHPPLHVVIPGLIMSVTGFSFTLAKSFSVIATGITGVAIWSIGREHLGRLAGLTAMGAFLFAAETLKASTNMTGINLTTMWMTLALWQALKGRGLSAGVLLGLAVCTGFYSMAAVCALIALGLFHSRGFALRLVASFVLVAGCINLLFYALAGEAYLDGVYRYHGLKATREAGMLPLLGGDVGPLSALMTNIGVMLDAKPFTRDVYYHAHLWLGGLMAPLIGAASWLSSAAGRANPLRFIDPRRFWRDGEHGVIAIVWLVCLALFLQYAMFRELYSFYFLLIYPTLSLCLGWGIWHCVRTLSASVEPGDEHPTRRLRAAIAAVGVGMLCLWPSLSAHANKAFPSELKNVGTKNSYEWRAAPVAEPLSEVAKVLYWSDHRLRGNLERGYRHYLWTKKRQFSKADDIAAWIAARSSDEETIAGASGAAPLIALLANRRLAAEESDTNSKRFKAARALPAAERAGRETTRLVDDATYWDAICADNVRFLISTSRSYFTKKKLGRLRIIREWFREAKVFWDEELKYKRRFPIIVYERKGSPLPDGKVCQWE